MTAQPTSAVPLVLVNSFVGRRGNIGARTAEVLATLERSGETPICICRGADKRSAATAYYSMSTLGHLPRVLNAFRIYLAPCFNHRLLDIWLFEQFALSVLRGPLKHANISVAHVWDSCPNLLRHLQSRGIRTVVDVPIAPTAYSARISRATDLGFLNDPKLQRLESDAYLCADVLIAPSRFVKAELVALGVDANRIEVIEFGATPALKHATPLGTQRSLTFCFVGNVSRRKGVPILLQAWDCDALRCHKLVLCGRVFPEMQQTLRRHASNNVSALGWVDAEEHLQDADVFVLPSWMEGSAKAVYEAMSFALPCVVSNATGSVITDGVDGLVIEAGDVAALRAALISLAQSAERRKALGEAARRTVQTFTWERYAQRVVDCLNATAS